MKLKPFLTAIFVVGLFIQDGTAQTSPPAQQPAITTQKAGVRAIQKSNTPVRVVDTVKNTDLSLNGQYQFLLSRSRSVNGYKLVNPYRLTTVWKSVTDTLAKERGELAKTKSKLLAQEKTIATLQAEAKGNESEVVDANSRMDEITFLGISFTKGTYNIVVWSIIIVLAIALFVVIARSTKNILEAKHRTQLYDEISAEYQAFKTKANEQQRKLARELQDERNIVEELKSKGR